MDLACFFLSFVVPMVHGRRKRIHGTPSMEDKRRAAARIVKFYKQKRREHFARLARQQATAMRNLRAANRAQRLRAHGVMLD